MIYERLSPRAARSRPPPLSTPPEVALLTGGGDRPYALGLASSLVLEGVVLDVIGSDELETPELLENPQVRFLNLRGAVSTDVSLPAKVARVVRYYRRLFRYAATADPRVFHILWNNKIELLDRTLLMLYYRLCRKRVVITVHNVNAGKRDGNDGLLNRLSLGAQYRLVDHLFVHTEQMSRELQADFGVRRNKISVIPFGINNTVPDTGVTPAEARMSLGLDESHQVILFFGNIARYKGLEFLVEALAMVSRPLPNVRLVIAGRVKCSRRYWEGIERLIADGGLSSRVILRHEFVPDAETEVYFKASDVLALPYVHVFQSGVLFLGYNFGLPVIATDVGSLREDVIEGKTGLVCRPRDPAALARSIRDYFGGDLYHELPARRRKIQEWARERHSWEKVARITRETYEAILVS